MSELLLLHERLFWLFYIGLFIRVYKRKALDGLLEVRLVGAKIKVSWQADYVLGSTKRPYPVS